MQQLEDYVDAKTDEIWQLGVICMIDWILFLTFLVFIFGIAGVYIPLRKQSLELCETLPKEEADEMDELITIAELYEQNPLRFAHLPGFEIPGYQAQKK